MTVTALLRVPCDLCLESVLLLNVCAEQMCQLHALYSHGWCSSLSLIWSEFRITECFRQLKHVHSTKVPLYCCLYCRKEKVEKHWGIRSCLLVRQHLDLRLLTGTKFYCLVFCWLCHQNELFRNLKCCLFNWSNSVALASASLLTFCFDVDLKLNCSMSCLWISTNLNVLFRIWW